MREIWYCDLSVHEHSTEAEAAWCMEIYALWQMATAQLMAYVREDEVEWAVNQALMGERSDEEERTR